MQLLGLTHNSVLVSIVMLGEVEACLSADGAVAEEGRAQAEVMLRTQGGSRLERGWSIISGQHLLYMIVN